MKLQTKILYLLCFLASACCKDTIIIKPFTLPPPTLPQITSEGKNTFGCLVNGEIYVPNDYFHYFYYAFKDNPQLYGTLSLRCNRDGNNTNSGFLIQLRNRVFSKGKHYIYTNSNTKDYLSHVKNNFDTYQNYTNDSNNFIDLIRLDTVNRIASGTFQFNLINTNNDFDTIRITEGRFDCKY